MTEGRKPAKQTYGEFRRQLLEAFQLHGATTTAEAAKIVVRPVLECTSTVTFFVRVGHLVEVGWRNGKGRPARVMRPRWEGEPLRESETSKPRPLRKQLLDGRLQTILAALPDGEFCAGDVSKKVKISSIRVTRALSALEEQGLVVFLKLRDKRKYWRLSAPRNAVLTPPAYRTGYRWW